MPIKAKTLDISGSKSAKDNISDLVLVGDSDTWKLIAKASSHEEGWMKSTKAMEITTVGVVVQVSTHQINIDGSNTVSEACTFVPDTHIVPDGGHYKLEPIRQ